MNVGFWKSSLPSNGGESNSNIKLPFESNTDIESLSMLDTRISLVVSCITIPLALPKYSSCPLSDEPNFN